MCCTILRPQTACTQRAFAANPEDARVLYEWDQLKKRAGLASPQERLRSLEEHRDLVSRRDDLTVEYITLLNQCGRMAGALGTAERSGASAPGRAARDWFLRSMFMLTGRWAETALAAGNGRGCA